MSQSLPQLVSDLPEIYQVIYGHPDIYQDTSRACIDRLDKIAEVHDALAKQLGRPLRVLDMGCAQGFFSLSLAARGAQVHGVDFLDKNIFVCQALALENPELKVTFGVGRLEEVVAALAPEQYDLVLGLSVLHHVVHEHGVGQVQPAPPAREITQPQARLPPQPAIEPDAPGLQHVRVGRRIGRVEQGEQLILGRQACAERDVAQQPALGDG